MPARADADAAPAGGGGALTARGARTPSALMPRRRRRHVARLPARARSVRRAHAALRCHMNSRPAMQSLTVVLAFPSRRIYSTYYNLTLVT